jgi:hypothetical protein
LTVVVLVWFITPWFMKRDGNSNIHRPKYSLYGGVGSITIPTGRNNGGWCAKRDREHSKQLKLTGSRGLVTVDAQNLSKLGHLRKYRSLSRACYSYCAYMRNLIFSGCNESSLRKACYKITCSLHATLPVTLQDRHGEYYSPSYKML